MNGSHPLWQLVLARFREFYREPMTIFWVYGFPLIMAVGLGIAFTSREPEPPKVDIQRVPGQEEKIDKLQALLKKAKMPVKVCDARECQQRRRIGETVLYVVP